MSKAKIRRAKANLMKFVHEQASEIVSVDTTRVRYLVEIGGRDGDDIGEVGGLHAQCVLGIDICGVEPVFGRVPTATLELGLKVIKSSRVHATLAVLVTDHPEHTTGQYFERVHRLHVHVHGKDELNGEDGEQASEVEENEPAAFGENAQTADEAD